MKATSQQHMNNSDDLLLLAYSRFPGFGARKIKKLLEQFGSAETLLRTPQSHLQQYLSDELAKIFVAYRRRINTSREETLLKKHDIALLPYYDDRFPPLLNEIPDAPLLLFTQGDVSLLSTLSVAVVGTRHNTDYGHSVCTSLVTELCRHDITIVSGLAYGIDAIAHEAALDVGGKLVGVLGSGHDEQSFTPKRNIALLRNVRERGCLISEYPPGTVPTEYSFPARNRIMAGISTGTLVVEAAKKSGSLITAELAFDYNREVFADPGKITAKQSMGTNKCIRDGAHVVLDMHDILIPLGFETRKTTQKKQEVKSEKTSPKGETPDEKEIIHALEQSSEPIMIDKIIEKTTLNTKTTLSVLSLLELRGVVQEIPGYGYVLV